ncbi:hypothetical protein KR018_012185 [Drosophila ironensis]|nr:hypothetical protein KR018_012185 [Drosophila ironensis]
MKMSQEMSEALPSDGIREKVRECAREQRREGRTQAKDALRLGLGQIKDEMTALEHLTAKDVHGLAGRIKRRKHATSEDLCRLSLAFLQGEENINAFAAIPGALQVLVKELTGPHAKRQIDAAECLCNLSLGEAHVADKIASLAGSYLVTYLDGKEERLKRCCLWTLANLLATCERARQTLLPMQLVPKLWKLYTDASDGCQLDAAACLHLVATLAPRLVSPEDRRYVAQHLEAKRSDHPAAEYLMYIVHQLEVVRLDHDLTPRQAESLVNFFLASLCSPCDSLSIIYGVRVMANLTAIGDATLMGAFADPVILARALNHLFALPEGQRLHGDLLQWLKNYLQLGGLQDPHLFLDSLKVFA